MWFTVSILCGMLLAYLVVHLGCHRRRKSS